MPLPLDDKNNPLYGLSKEAQCQVFVQWQQKRLTPYQLLSLPKQYNQEQITKAYRQLALLFHPDRNPKNKLAEGAFKLLSAACEYLEYGLKTGMERYEAEKTIINNTFYQVYGEEGLGRIGSTPPFFGGFQSTSSFTSASANHSLFDSMSFSQLLYEVADLLSDHTSHLPAKLITALKRHIEADKSLLRAEIPYSTTFELNLKGANIAHMIAHRGDDDDFLKWLIEVGADPTIKAKKYRDSDPAYDVIQLLAQRGYKFDILSDLLKRFGADLLYNKDKSGMLHPQWWRFEQAIKYKGLSLDHAERFARFLTKKVGYTSHANGQSIKSLRQCILSLKGILFRSYNDMISSDFDRKNALEIFNLLFNQEDVFPAILYLGIQELLDVFEKTPESINDYEHYNAIKNLLFQLIDRLHIQPNELATIYSVTQKNKKQKLDNARKACIWAIYNTALDHVNVEILQKLHTISHLPRFSYNARETLLARAFIADLRERLHSDKRKYRGFSRFGRTNYFFDEDEYIDDFEFEEEKAHDFKPQHEVKSKYPRIFSILVGLNRFGRLQDLYSFTQNRGYGIDNFDDEMHKYWEYEYQDYSLLHLACEAKWQDLALQLIKKMKTKSNAFDTIATRRMLKYRYIFRESKDDEAWVVSTTSYHFSSLHLAITNKLTEVAVSLIEAGADIHLKAVIDEPPASGDCCTFFSTREQIEKTPLEMAIETGQPQVIRALQRAMLKDYIKQREADESEYLSQVSLFGYVLFSLGSINLCGLVLGFGNHSKTAKLQKAYEFRELLNRGELNEAVLENFNSDVSQEGRLGQIIQLSHHYLTRSISLNNPLRI